MNIALLAHPRKQELMVQFCIAYKRILSEHSISAPSTSGNLIVAATKLPVNLCLCASQGGIQQIAARISYNEIDIVLFFCDPSEERHADVNAIARLCDQYNVPFASNAATAEILIQGLQRGDVSCRSA